MGGARMQLFIKGLGLLAVAGMLVVGGLILTVRSWLNSPTCANSPKEMLEGVLFNPAPEDIHDTQGVGNMWQSYEVWLRFRASEASITRIVADGFAPITWAEAEPKFHLPRVSIAAKNRATFAVSGPLYMWPE
jgi:hypothetical protein